MKAEKVMIEINRANQERYKTLGYKLWVLVEIIIFITRKIFERLDEIEAKIDKNL
jgi:hypothetical protein